MWGIYTHAYRRSGLTPMQGAALVGLWSALALVPAGAPALVEAVSRGLAAPVMVQAVLQGVVAGTMSMILYGIAIDRLGASPAAAISPLGPVLATLLAIPLLGEWPDAAAIAGMLAATLGVVLASGVLRERDP
jgi:drug/metabolite transporter (DMT)-like permease